MKSNFLFIVCTFLLLNVYLIANDVFNDYQMQPEVHHMVKPHYGEVDAKGDLNLNIPLMTVPGRNGLDFPIAFNYHSGVTVKQNSTWIGLGWSWDPGSITRDVKGSLIYNNDVMGVDFPGSTDNYAHDIYYIHIDGSTTPFYEDYLLNSPFIKPNNDFIPGKWQPWKVNFLNIGTVTVDNNYQSTEPDYGRIVVTKENGLRYIYDVPSLAYYINLNSDGSISGSPDVFVSTWRIKAILAADYDDQNGSKYIPSNNDPGGWIKFEYKYDTNDFYSLIANAHLQNQSLLQLTYLKKIITPTHEAAINTELRTDTDALSPDLTISEKVHRALKSIRLYSKHDLNKPIKTIKLNHNAIAPYFPESPNNGGKLSLKGLSIIGRNSHDSLRYDFEYYFPEQSAEVAYSIGDYDDFGYHNKAHLSYWNGDTTYEKSWSLKKINYPSGGTETFFYENDEINQEEMSYFHWDHLDVKVEKTYEIPENGYKQGGVRIKKIIHDDIMSGTNQVYRYKYGITSEYGTLRTGYLTAVPPYYFIKKDRAMNTGGSRGHAAVYYSDIHRENPDGSEVRTKYSIGEEANVFCFSVTQYTKYSILQDNADWDWGQIQDIVYINKDGNISQIENKIYDNFSYNLSENSLQANYPISYKVGFNLLKENISKIYNCGTLNSGTDLIEYKTTYDYLPYYYLLRKETEQNSNGTSEIWRSTDYEYAFEHYIEMENKNMLSQNAKSDISVVDPSLSVTEQKTVEAEAFEERPNDSDSELFTVNFPTYVDYNCSITTSGKGDAFFYIYENGEEIRRQTSTGSGSFLANTGKTYEIKAVAEINGDPVGEDNAYCEGTIQYEVVSSVEYYSSTVNTWEEISIDEGYPVFWKPRYTYKWNDNVPHTISPSFSWWNGTQPSEQRWKLISTNEEYDKHGNLIKIKDAKDNLTTLYYGDNSENKNNEATGLFNSYLTAVEKGNLSQLIDYFSFTGYVSSIEDANGKKKFFKYDCLGRLSQIRDHEQNIISENYYYLSKNINGTLNINDPNYIRTMNYGLNEDMLYNPNLAPNYGFELDHVQSNYKPVFWKNEIYSSDINSYSVVNGGVGGNQCAKLGFNTNYKTSIVTDFIPIDGNLNYNLSGDIKTEHYNARAYIAVEWCTHDFAPIRTDYITGNLNPTWQHFSNTLLSPPDAVYAKLMALNWDLYFTAWFDNIKFLKGIQELDVKQQISNSYFDGFSRNNQNQQSYENEVIVSATDYDPTDRTQKNWKSYAKTNEFQFDSDYKTNAINYYNGSNNRPDAGNYPFIEKFYFSEISDFAKYVIPEGNSYRDNNYLKFKYLPNSSGEVNGYEANYLWKTQAIDENKNAKESFTDHFGRTIAEKQLGFQSETTVQNTVSFSALAWRSEDEGHLSDKEIRILEFEIEQDVSFTWNTYFPITGEASLSIIELPNNQLYMNTRDYTDILNSSFHAIPGKSYKIIITAEAEPNPSPGGNKINSHILIDSDFPEISFNTMTTTTFEYDLMNNLLKVINPKNQITEYRYNTLNQLIAQVSPDFDGDGDTDPTNEDFTDLDDCDIRYKYDVNGNLRFMQDANHRQGGKDLVFYQYDEFNRQTLIGAAILDASIPSWSNLDPDILYNNCLAEENFECISNYPDNVKQQIYYDGDNAYTGANNLLGRVSCIKYKTDNQWSYIYYSYTDEGWVEWMVNDIMGIEVKIEYEYDLQGNVTKLIYDSDGNEKLFCWYEYNELGQLSKVYSSQFYFKPTYPDVIYEYWPTGAVKTLKFGQEGSSQYAEEMEYTYNERDWLKTINTNDVLQNNNKFAMELYYNNPNGTTAIPQYNGNISVAEYCSGTPEFEPLDPQTVNKHKYEFSYDPLYRLTGANFFYGNQGSWSSSNHYKVENITYDGIGNILTLTRKNDNGVGNSYNYFYESGTNRLDWVDNNEHNGTEQIPDNYVYDSNGNVIEDHVKSINSSQQILYNYRNLPTYVEEQINNNSIYYAYDFNGNRIYKYFDSVEGSSNDTKRYYLRGMDGNTLAVYDKNKNLIFYNLYGLDLIGRIVK